MTVGVMVYDCRMGHTAVLVQAFAADAHQVEGVAVRRLPVGGAGHSTGPGAFSARVS